MTGFRPAPGGAAEYFGVAPDLFAFGKIIAGSMPVGAYGGRRKIMRLVSLTGPVYQAETLSGNPVAMAVGIAMLRQLEGNGDLYAALDEKTERLEAGLAAVLPGYAVNRCGSILSVFFTEVPVCSFS